MAERIASYSRVGVELTKRMLQSSLDAASLGPTWTTRALPSSTSGSPRRTSKKPSEHANRCVRPFSATDFAGQMSVYVDDWRQPATVRGITSRWSHLTADTTDELHLFARAIGHSRQGVPKQARQTVVRPLRLDGGTPRESRCHRSHLAQPGERRRGSARGRS